MPSRSMSPSPWASPTSSATTGSSTATTEEGRFDGGDSNYGVVNIKDETYITLTQEMARINARAEQLHRGK